MKEPLSWLARVEAYLSYRRSLGFALTTEATTLRQFARYAEKIALEDPLTTVVAIQWARSSEHQGLYTWKRRTGTLRGFAKFCKRFDASTEIPPVDVFGTTYRRPRPHIFTEEEIATLLSATDHLFPRQVLRRATCRIVFGLLASTGLRISEALNLTKGDVDLTAGVLTIREAKCHTQRLVPIHSTVTAELESYAQLRDRILYNQSSAAPPLKIRGPFGHICKLPLSCLPNSK